MNINKKHLYFWLLYYCFLFILDYLRYGENFNIYRNLFMMFMQISIFYSFLLVLSQIKGNSSKNWVRAACCLLFSLCYILFLNFIRTKIAGYYGQLINKSLRELIIDTVAYYNVLAFYALGYYYLTRSNLKEKELRKLGEEKAATELAAAQLALQNAQLAEAKTAAELFAAQSREELLQMELNFLRAQINPHFLYNTLNYFYDRALDNDAELAQGMITLSEIMRYSLETTQLGQLVPLPREVAHLQQVIDMYQLRTRNRLPLVFSQAGKYGSVQVTPLIFITLLENALKHGVVNDPAHPIDMRLTVDNTHIRFAIRNTINPQPNRLAEQSHGIGLVNIQKRLHHVYGNRCHFEVTSQNDRYEVALEIAYRDS